MCSSPTRRRWIHIVRHEKILVLVLIFRLSIGSYRFLSINESGKDEALQSSDFCPNSVPFSATVLCHLGDRFPSSLAELWMSFYFAVADAVAVAVATARSTFLIALKLFVQSFPRIKPPLGHYNGT